MSALPNPLVPTEVDLQDFPFMPLHVARLRDSNLAAEEEPETCWYAVLLWAASWHQIPAGSLPDNDTVLMRLVGLGRDQRTWKKHRAGALRGFVLCNDGRFYHPVVAETALESWNSKLRQRHAKFCAAIRQHNKRNPDNIFCSPSFDEWENNGRPEKVTEAVTETSRVTEANVTRDSDTKGREGTGKGQGESIEEEPDGSSVARRRAHQLPDDFEPVLTEDAQRHADFLGRERFEQELRDFRDHHTAKGTTMKDWQAAFRTWLSNAVKWTRGRNGPGQPLGNGRSKDGVELALDRDIAAARAGSPPGEAGRHEPGDRGAAGEGSSPRIAAVR